MPNLAEGFDPDKYFRVYSPGGKRKITDIDNDPETHFDILLVTTFTATRNEISLGIKRLAEACYQASLKVGVLAIKDPRKKADKMIDFEGPLATLLNLSSKCAAIGFSVFDHDIGCVLEYLREIKATLSSSALPLRTVYIGGVGIIDNFAFWEKEISLCIKQIGLTEVEVCLVRGEADEALPKLLKGEQVTEGVRILNATAKNRVPLLTASEPGIIKVRDDQDPKNLKLSPLALEGRWESPNAIGPLLISLGEKIQRVMEERPLDYRAQMDDVISTLSHIRGVDAELSRDCPHHCKYCALQTTAEGAIRRLSPQNAVDQFEHYFHVGKTYFNFQDDDIFFDRKWWKEATQFIKARKLNDWLNFAGFAHPATLRTFHSQDISQMAQCGLNAMTFGLESANEDELERMGRPKKSPEWVLGTLPKLAHHDISVSINFIDGYPGFHRNARAIYRDRKVFLAACREILGSNLSWTVNPFVFAPGKARTAMSEVTATAKINSLDAVLLAEPFELGGRHRRPCFTYGRFGSAKQSETATYETLDFYDEIVVGHPAYGNARVFRDQEVTKGLDELKRAISGKDAAQFPDLQLASILSIIAAQISNISPEKFLTR